MLSLSLFAVGCGGGGGDDGDGENGTTTLPSWDTPVQLGAEDADAGGPHILIEPSGNALVLTGVKTKI